MKQLTIIPIIAALLLCGCGTLTVKDGSEPAVVWAEYGQEVALEVFDNFLKWERTNEAALKTISPDIHVAANLIRQDAPGWLNAAAAATRAYKENRTADNLSKLKAAQAALEQAVSLAREYLAKGGKRVSFVPPAVLPSTAYAVPRTHPAYTPAPYIIPAPIDMTNIVYLTNIPLAYVETPLPLPVLLTNIVGMTP